MPRSAAMSPHSATGCWPNLPALRRGTRRTPERRTRLSGEAQARGQAAARACGELELPAMGARDAIDDREPETGAAAAASRLVEARKRPLQALGLALRHARAAVHDFDEHAAAIATRFDFDR